MCVEHDFLGWCVCDSSWQFGSSQVLSSFYFLFYGIGMRADQENKNVSFYFIFISVVVFILWLFFIFFINFSFKFHSYKLSFLWFLYYVWPFFFSISPPKISFDLIFYSSCGPNSFNYYFFLFNFILWDFI